MKNTIYLIFFALLWCACKDHQLEEFKPQNSDPLQVSAGNIRGKITRDNDKVTFQVGIGLSAPTEKAFQVGLNLNPDTIKTLIANGTLTNAVLLTGTNIQLPNVAEVGYGVDSAFFKVQVNLSVFEQYYGKKLAMAVTLTEPTKGNKVSKKTSIILLDSKALIKEEEIHYLSIKNGGGGIMEVTRGKNYQVTSAGVSIALDVSLSGIPGTAFRLKTMVIQDTIAGLVAQNKLPANTYVLQEGKYLLDTVVNFGGNKSISALVLSIPWNVMDENLNRPVAVAVRLYGNNKHVLHPVNKSVIVLVDPSVSLDNNSFITGNGTGLKAEYFKNTQQLNEGGKMPDLVRIDPQINFVGWRPFSDSDDNWSSRWTGEFLAPVRGEYTFYQTKWDDGARLFINGVTLVDDFTTEWDKPSRFGKIFLERGQKYKIEVHHRENVGGQQAVLEYEVSSAGVGRQVVPKSQLFPAQ